MTPPNSHGWYDHSRAFSRPRGYKAQDVLRIIAMKVVKATESGGMRGFDTLEIIKRSDNVKDFEVLPRRWVVERTFAWLGRC